MSYFSLVAVLQLNRYLFKKKNVLSFRNYFIFKKMINGSIH